MSDPTPSAPTFPPNRFMSSRGALKTVMDDPARYLPEPDPTPAIPSRLQQHIKTVLGPGSEDLDQTLRPGPTREAPSLDAAKTLLMTPAQQVEISAQVARAVANLQTVIKPIKPASREELFAAEKKAPAAAVEDDTLPPASKALELTPASQSAAAPARRVGIWLAVAALALAGVGVMAWKLKTAPRFETSSIVEIQPVNRPPPPVPPR